MFRSITSRTFIEHPPTMIYFFIFVFRSAFGIDGASVVFSFVFALVKYVVLHEMLISNMLFRNTVGCICYVKVGWT